MDNQQKTIIAVVVVAIIIIASVGAVLVLNGKNHSSAATIDSNLMVRGNADGNYTIDSKDMDIVKDIVDGKKTLADYPNADVNNDGTVNQTDIDLLQNLIDRKDGCKIYILCLDRSGKQTTVEATYPLMNVVTYGTNMQEAVVYSEGASHVAGYFKLGYAQLEKGMSGAEDLKGTQRSIPDSAWTNFTALDAKLVSVGGVGALMVDYSGVKQITDQRAQDLDAAGIPLIIYAVADAISEINATLTLSFLFGKTCEEKGIKYAQESWNVLDQINSKVKGLNDKDRTTYIALTMWIYICQNDSTYNTTAATAGGLPYYKVNDEFAQKYKGSGSTKMETTEALQPYTNVGVLINNRSLDVSITDRNAMIIETWEGDDLPQQTYFKGFEEKLFYVNNVLPGAVKTAYMAHFLYPDLFSLDWANSVLKTYIGISSALSDQTMDSIIAYVTYDDYKHAKGI